MQHIIFNIVCVSEGEIKRFQVVKTVGDDVCLDRNKLEELANNIASNYNKTVSVTYERIYKD